ncbi:hypothetical protein DHEL01_v211263 [Diaporthe helianthi]|uniref:Haloacid dehalogenase-like hydrolase n=1 Tax=Diaporthe helianthi TaxID=158607 RepID=A0A2P5HJC1_DIAHE|nr:hypothetical protein DHEL01_v211263 [Diaporthe helianthi]
MISTRNFKALVFDLGGVLLEWDHGSIDAISPEQFLAITNSTAWHSLDRGEITLKEACKEHLEIVKGLDLPWSLFERVFASGLEGMRKLDLCFFDHVINEIGVHPSEMIMFDDMPENVCAARSRGIHAILVHNSLPSVRKTLLNLLHDPIQRGEGYLHDKAREHHCVVEGHEELTLKDNFSQLMIWELTGDDEIVYLKWPYGSTHGLNPIHTENSPQNRPSSDHTGIPTSSYANGRSSGDSTDASNGSDVERSCVDRGLWNFFIETPVLTTRRFPADADTTATAYLSLPQRPHFLDMMPDVQLILDSMADNLDLDGIMQVYFDAERPRTVPEVCCNILRLFHKFGLESDPRVKKSEDYVVECLNNNACLYGNRHYSTPESFLYFVARLYAETSSDAFRLRLDAIKTQLKDRLDVPANPLALALRLFACQVVGLDPELYRKDLGILVSLQDEDGGWPAGHFCRLGRTGRRIGSRGLTTALAVRILQHERRAA